MLGRLPAEIIIMIISAAARALALEDRASVVNLACTSSAAYHVVAPHLYRVMWCTDDNNASFFEHFADVIVTTSGALGGSPAARVARHVRTLIEYVFWDPCPVNAANIRLFDALEDLVAHSDFVHVVFESGTSALHRNLDNDW
jgi:hypothetical protein